MSWRRRSRVLAGVTGVALGAAASALGGVEVLAFYGFWGGLMWPLLVLAPLAFWYSARRQQAVGVVLALALGASAGLAPVAWAGGRGSGADEIWFPLAMGFLATLTLGPLYVGLARRLADRATKLHEGAT